MQGIYLISEIQNLRIFALISKKPQLFFNAKPMPSKKRTERVVQL